MFKWLGLNLKTAAVAYALGHPVLPTTVHNNLGPMDKISLLWDLESLLYPPAINDCWLTRIYIIERVPIRRTELSNDTEAGPFRALGSGTIVSHLDAHSKRTSVEEL